MRLECDFYHLCKNCSHHSGRPCKFCCHCASFCILYQKDICRKLSRLPYVCNGCPDKKVCTLEKGFYDALAAQKEYEQIRSESRSGFAISEPELQRLDSVLSPLLRNGQSARNIDMPRKVRLRPRKAKPIPFKVDKSCHIGRTYQDFLVYMALNPDTPVVELDSVEGIKGGKVLLTIHFVKNSLMLAFLRDSNDSQSVIDIFDRLYLELRPEVFMDLFPVFLVDNGSEFSNPTAIEFDRQGNRKCHLFYCDSSAPFQKGAAENNHEFIRRIIPKRVDFGLYTQDHINLMMSHINSYLRRSLGNKSPYETFAFQYGTDILEQFWLSLIPPDEITLSPKLLK